MRFTAFCGRVRRNKLIKNLISKYSYKDILTGILTENAKPDPDGCGYTQFCYHLSRNKASTGTGESQP